MGEHQQIDRKAAQVCQESCQGSPDLLAGHVIASGRLIRLAEQSLGFNIQPIRIRSAEDLARDRTQ